MKKIPEQAEKERTPLIRVIFPLIIMLGLAWALWADASNPVEVESAKPVPTQTTPTSTQSPTSKATQPTPVPSQIILTPAPTTPIPTRTVSLPMRLTKEESDKKFALIESQVALHESWETRPSTENIDTYNKRLEINRKRSRDEFRLTCDWLNYSRVGAVLPGAGAGRTPANFELYLKTCGDETLTYLPALKALDPE